MTTHDRFDARITEPVEDFVYLSAGNAENVFHAVGFECFYNHVSARFCRDRRV
jgi:hypothetical protein